MNKITIEMSDQEVAIFRDCWREYRDDPPVTVYDLVRNRVYDALPPRLKPGTVLRHNNHNGRLSIVGRYDKLYFYDGGELPIAALTDTRWKSYADYDILWVPS